jgi:hypothetical protein
MTNCKHCNYPINNNGTIVFGHNVHRFCERVFAMLILEQQRRDYKTAAQTKQEGDK